MRYDDESKVDGLFVSIDSPTTRVAKGEPSAQEVDTNFGSGLRPCGFFLSRVSIESSRAQVFFSSSTRRYPVLLGFYRVFLALLLARPGIVELYHGI